MVRHVRVELVEWIRPEGVSDIKGQGDAGLVRLGKCRDQVRTEVPQLPDLHEAQADQPCIGEARTRQRPWQLRQPAEKVAVARLHLRDLEKRRRHRVQDWSHELEVLEPKRSQRAAVKFHQARTGEGASDGLAPHEGGATA